MRKFSLILVAAMLLSVSSVFGNNGLDDNPSQTLSQQISALLSKDALRMPWDTEMHALVYFTVNSEKEIVVLSVKTNEEELESYLKGRLNYIKVECSNYMIGVTYKIPVTMKS